MATDMSGLNELDQFLVREPAIDKQVLKADSLQDCPLDHTDKVVNLALEVFFSSLCSTAVCVTLSVVSGIQFLLSQALRFGRFLPHLTLERKVHEGLCLSVREQEEQSLVAKNALVLDMGEDTAQHFPFATGLRKVGVISNQTSGILAPGRVTAHGNASQKPAIEAVHDLSPVDVRIGQKAIEHILMAGKHLTKNARCIVEAIPDREEREQDHQFKNLTGRELAVHSLGKLHLPLVNLDMVHHVHDPLNRLRIVTFSKKAVEFRDNMPIFVHAKVNYV
jgi:hypothetical protein